MTRPLLLWVENIPGGRAPARRGRTAPTADLSESEQSGVEGAAEETLQALAAGNRDYEEKFGHIFLVCATGKSADEMLACLQRRMDHDPGDEVHVAAAEQALITRLRLEKIAQ